LFGCVHEALFNGDARSRAILPFESSNRAQLKRAAHEGVASTFFRERLEAHARLIRYPARCRLFRVTVRLSGVGIFRLNQRCRLHPKHN
jgi:hypothetical protein